MDKLPAPLALLFGLLFLVAIWGPVFAYLLLQLYSAVRLERGWRMAALLPLLVMVPVAIIAVNEFNKQSNLWPMLLILASPVAAIYLVVLIYRDRAARRQKATDSPEEENR